MIGNGIDTDPWGGIFRDRTCGGSGHLNRAHIRIVLQRAVLHAAHMVGLIVVLDECAMAAFEDRFSLTDLIYKSIIPD